VQVAEVHLFGFNDPVLAVLSVAGLIGFGIFVAAAVLRLGGRRAWDRAFVAGGILLAVAFIGTMLYTWIASPVLR